MFKYDDENFPLCPQCGSRLLPLKGQPDGVPLEWMCGCKPCNHVFMRDHKTISKLEVADLARAVQNAERCGNAVP